MLKTRLCELLGLEVPIILAPMGTCEVSTHGAGGGLIASSGRAAASN